MLLFTRFVFYDTKIRAQFSSVALARTHAVYQPTLFLDIDVERGLARRVANDDEMNRLDLEKVSFHQRVRQGYHALLQTDKDRWVQIDADRPFADIQVELQEIVMNRLDVADAKQDRPTN